MYSIGPRESCHSELSSLLWCWGHSKAGSPRSKAEKALLLVLFEPRVKRAGRSPGSLDLWWDSQTYWNTPQEFIRLFSHNLFLTSVQGPKLPHSRSLLLSPPSAHPSKHHISVFYQLNFRAKPMENFESGVLFHPLTPFSGQWKGALLRARSRDNWEFCKALMSTAWRSWLCPHFRQPPRADTSHHQPWSSYAGVPQPRQGLHSLLQLPHTLGELLIRCLVSWRVYRPEPSAYWSHPSEYIGFEGIQSQKLIMLQAAHWEGFSRANLSVYSVWWPASYRNTDCEVHRLSLLQSNIIMKFRISTWNPFAMFLVLQKRKIYEVGQQATQLLRPLPKY